MPTIRVALVDDHPLMLNGLQDLLSRSGGFEVVATGKSPRDILNICKVHEPEVIVVDLFMGCDICAVIAAAIRIAPRTKIVAFTAALGVEPAILALDAGATGYVSKGGTSAELVQAIEYLFTPEGPTSRIALRRSSVLLSRPPRRPVEGDLARWSGRVPVHEAPGAGPLLVAEPGRRRGDDLVGAARLPVCPASTGGTHRRHGGRPRSDDLLRLRMVMDVIPSLVVTATESLPADLAAAHAMILAERAARLQAEMLATTAKAEVANAKADLSSTEALISHLKLEIEKLRRQLYCSRSERKARLLDQMEFQLEELEAKSHRRWARRREGGSPRRRPYSPSGASGRRASRSPSTCHASAS